MKRLARMLSWDGWKWVVLICAFALLAERFCRATECPSGQQCVGRITAVASSCALDGAVVLNLSATAGSATVSLLGPFVGTVQFEQSNDNKGSWIGILGIPQPTGVAVTSATAPGTWRFEVGATTQICVRASAFTSGLVNTTINQSIAYPSVFVAASVNPNFNWQTPSAADSGKWAVYYNKVRTITKIYCKTDGLGTLDLNFEIRPEDHGNDAGTVVLAAPITCTGTGTSTSTILNAVIPGSSTFGYILTPTAISITGTPGYALVSVITQ